MKNLFTLLFIFLISTVNSQVSYFTTFETDIDGWTGGWARFTGSTACDGAHAARKNIYTTGTQGDFTSPLLGTAGGNAVNLSFDYKIADWSANTTGTSAAFGSITIEWSNDQTNWFNIGLIDPSNHIVSGDCANQSYSFTPSAGPLYIRFVCLYGSGDYYMNFDNISLLEAGACPGATGLTASNININSADLSFNAVTGAVDYNIEVGLPGFNPGTGNEITAISNITSTSTTASGLTPNTTYEYYVQTNCGTNLSAWSGPYTFTTPCTALIAPWIETFSGNAIPSCWTQSATTGGPWVFGVTTNPDFGNTTEPNDHTSGVPDLYTWVDQSSTDAGVILTSPVIDVSALTIPELKFFVYSTNNTGSVTVFNILNVEYFDGTSWQLVQSIQGDFGEQWTQFSYDASSYVYGTNLVQFRFRVESGGDSNDYDNDILLDDVSVNEMPSCPSPVISNSEVTGPNTATISWEPVNPTPANGYQYYVSLVPGIPAPGTVPTGTTTDTSVNLISLNSDTTYYYYIASDCGTDVGPWSAGGNFFTGYCTPAPSSVDGSGITNVTFGTINNSTGAEPGNYGDYSSLSNDVAQSTTATVNITYETGYTYDTKIWIDWNDDLDFTDAGEEVYSGMSLATNPTTLTATFTVPLTAPLGAHRMRIGGQDVGPPVPCYSGSYGSYEDYTIVVTAPPSCLAPDVVYSYGVTSSGATVGWSIPSPAPSNGYVYYVSTDPAQPAVGATPTGAVSDTSVILTGLLSDTTYYVWVASDCGTEVGPWSVNTNFYTGYCVPDNGSGCQFGDLIANVTLNTLSNNSGTTCVSDYNDYTDDPLLTTTLLPSSTYNCVIGSGAYSQSYAVWIDYNDDLNFDVSERVGYTTAPVAANSTASFPIALSCNPPEGDHVMRVRSAWNVQVAGIDITPCGSQSYGETEDYLITIAPAPSCPSTGFLSASNPSESTIDLTWLMGCSSAAYFDIEYGQSGYTLGSGTLVSGVLPLMDSIGANYTLTGLNPNTAYDVYVRASCDSLAGDFSSWSVVATDTTDCLFNYSIDTVSSCDFYDWNGQLFSVSGIYTDTLLNQYGCDSVVTLDLTVNPTLTSSTDTTVCNTELPFDWNGLTFSAAGSQTAILTSVVTGCDSIALLDVTINFVDTGITQIDDVTLQADAVGAQYQWFDCNTNEAITGEINQTFVATSTGDYGVIVTENSCADTSSCITVNVVGIQDVSVDFMDVYPNPTTNLITIQSESVLNNKFKIYDQQGREVMNGKLTGKNTEVSLGKLSRGTYTIQVDGNYKPAVIVKQ